MTNTQALRNIIEGLKDEMLDTTEALEFIEAIEDQLDGKDERIKELEKDIEDMGEAEEKPAFTSVFLGLDTIEYRLEKGNLEITQRVETFLNRLK